MKMGEPYDRPDRRDPAAENEHFLAEFGDQRMVNVTAGGGRWPRHETLILLEVRTLLDSSFREASPKGPLWEEVSRIMEEQHGYRRSGKKCREKLENLYKYYKKTKDKKSGRHDGGHYRFFRQLEALYGESSNSNNKNSSNPTEPPQPHKLYESLSFWDSESSSTEDDEDDNDTEDQVSASMSDKGDQHKGWKMKVRELVEREMRRFMASQEAWLDKMLGALEKTEQQRTSREDTWRREEVARWDRDQRLWAHEAAWIKARDKALVEALDNISRRRSKPLSIEDYASVGNDEDDDRSEFQMVGVVEGDLSIGMY